MAESDTIGLQEVIRYRDANGFLQELKVTSSDARAIRAVRQAARREEIRWKSRHRSFTDMEIDAGSVAEAPLPTRESGLPWEGPRIRFPWLVGESRTWHGNPIVLIEGSWYCSVCWGQWLPEVAYCLGCDATGRDASIPAVTEEDMKRRGQLRAYRPSQLKGGLSGKQ